MSSSKSASRDTGNGASLAAGQMVFYDNCVPTLEVDDYLIEVTQVAPVAATGHDTPETYAVSQGFSVQGPRYALPPNDVFSMFPPDHSEGVFNQFLPHVVLTKRELPWERDVFHDKDSQRGTQTPWLALLLFVENEQIGGRPALLPPSAQNPRLSAPITADSFYDWAAGKPSERTQPAEGILWPRLTPAWHETEDALKSTTSVVIDLSPEAFKTLLPPYPDLPYLAHARQVDASAKDQQALNIAGDGWYSVVVGNRLGNAPPKGASSRGTEPAEPGQRNIVHLVSLEGFAEYIKGQSLPAGTSRVRMISLQSWSFTCRPDAGESFSKLMQGLIADAGNRLKSTSFALPVPSPAYDSTTQDASQALGSGYVPLRYQTRLGEQTFGWYRGPFSPVPVADFVTGAQQPRDDSIGRPFDSASAALIYDPKYGVFDVSYAVAFETGRLLALADGHFGQLLMAWQRNGHQHVDLILERASQVPALRTLRQEGDDPTAAATLPHLLGPHALTEEFVPYLAEQFAAKMTSRLADRQAAPSVLGLRSNATTTSPVATRQAVRALLEHPLVRSAVRAHGSQGVDTLVDWLAHLYLLVNVPFENLVPHEGLLPPESVRFFYLDPNWLAALVEGALAIGIESSRDAHYQDLMKDVIWKATHETVPKVRARLHPNTPASTTSAGPMAGMLLRSAVVAGWPGLSVNGYTKADSQGGNAPDPASRMPLRRMERLSDDVLLCLWPSVPALVSIDEPHEGVAFGFEDPPHGEGDYLDLRSLDPASYGTLLPGRSIDARATNVIDASNIVKITAADGLIQLIQSALPGSPAVHIRDFAVQMVRVPERAVFAPPAIDEGSDDRAR